VTVQVDAALHSGGVCGQDYGQGDWKMRALTVEELGFVSGGEDWINVTAKRVNRDNNYDYGISFGDETQLQFTRIFVPLGQDGTPVENVPFRAAGLAAWNALKGRDLNGDGTNQDEFEWTVALGIAIGLNVAAIVPAVKAGMTAAQFLRLFTATTEAAGATAGVVALIGIGASRGYY
jgi:hypothetical protein